MMEQEKIEKIIEELNELALDKVFAECSNFQTNEFKERIKADQSENRQLQINERKEELDLLLCDLGVRKIDPQNEIDMHILEELVSTSSHGDETLRNNPIDTAPDLAACANAFSVYIRDGVRTYNNEEHRYRYIWLVDDKGSNKLTQHDKYELVSKDSLTQSVMESVLNYNFGFLFSRFMGKVPNGVQIEWTLGSIFSILQGINNASGISRGSEDFYLTDCISVTSMTYYYYYNDPDWKLVGTSANMSFLQTDYFSGNVHGEPVSETNERQKWSVSTGGIWADYIEAYADRKEALPDYHQVDALGSFDIKGFRKTYTFTPVFYELPGYIW